ncbi:hypothetical protein INR49_028308 [Caranx melampygus]|nr:hypothetical protein INR49_028308 [Caranx melampygus]
MKHQRTAALQQSHPSSSHCLQRLPLSVHVMSDCNKQRSALRDRRLLTPRSQSATSTAARGDPARIFICSSMCRRSCSSSSPSSDFLLLSSSSTAATPFSSCSFTPSSSRSRRLSEIELCRPGLCRQHTTQDESHDLGTAGYTDTGT